MIWSKAEKRGEIDSLSPANQDQNGLINNQFYLDLPAQWTDVTVHTFLGPEEDGVRHDIFVVIDSDSKAKTVEEFAKPKINALAKELQGYVPLNSAPLFMNNGMPAFEHVYRWAASEQREVIQRMVYVLAGTKGYTLTTTFSVKTWKMMGAKLDGIIRSFVPMISEPKPEKS
ncbi:MAG: DUF1795 domain-containing protein [Gammaproteobacteria bacterium]|nr:DUF1795 domain-containing protein [Gammaproteobacteria bacterium]